MIDKFEKENPNIHIQMDSPSDAMTILKTRLVKENPPDIAILGGERSYPLFFQMFILLFIIFVQLFLEKLVLL